jgi:hypothetical protein
MNLAPNLLPRGKSPAAWALTFLLVLMVVVGGPGVLLAADRDAARDAELLPRAQPRFKQPPAWFAKVARNVHVDFHTPAWAKVGEKFDARVFADTIAGANCSSAVVFAKCHHGFAYYPTKAGVRHPQLDFDLLGAQSKALHERGVFCFAYFSANVDAEQNRRHPDWRQVHEGGRANEGNFSAVCFNSPYRENVFIPQLEEVVQNYPVDGLWIDMMGYYQDRCFCQHCQAKAGNQGVDLKDKSQRYQFTEELVREVVREVHGRLKKIRPAIVLHFNHLTKLGMREALAYEDLSNVESPIPLLNYTYFPTYARYVRTLGQPFGGVTNRFDVGYGRFGTLKSEQMLEYEAAGMLSNGGICTVVDQVPHHLRLEAPAYDRLREAFAFAREREPWCLGSVSVPEIAVLAPHQLGYFGWAEPDNALYGAVTALTELHQHFDVIDRDEDFDRYRLIVLPGANPPPSPAACKRLADYVAGGGRLLAVDLDLTDSMGELKNALGIERAEPNAKFKSGYLRPVGAAMQRGLPKMDLLVGATFRDVVARSGVETLFSAVMPIGVDFYGHAGPPASDDPSGPAITWHRHGKGAAAYVGLPLLSVFYGTPTLSPRNVFANIVDRLLPPAERLLDVSAPLSVEVNLMAQPGRRILHLINFHAERQRGDKRYTLEDVLKIQSIRCQVALPNLPTKVYLAPSKTELAWRPAGQRVEVTVPELLIHEMVVFEGMQE